MQATSAAPNPVLPSASPVDSQSADTSVSGSDGQESSPFAAVLEKQVKAPADKPDAPAAAKKSADSAAETPRDAPVDAVTILASMLAGVTVPSQTATASTSDALGSSASSQTTAAEESRTGPDATTIIATALPIAIPVAVPVATSTASNDGNVAGADSGATQTFAPAAETGASAGRPAIVAVDAASKEEASAENGNNASAQDSRFGTLLDAARAGGENATGPSSANMAALATSTHVTPAAHASSASATLVSVRTPVGAEGWSHEVGEKLTWMVGRQENRAELVLNPPQLGRIEVSISMNGDQANANFVSANPAVRDALEDAMPHLREVLQGAGISLGQTQVGAESFQQAASQRENGDNSRRGGDAGNDGAAGVAASGETSASQWLRRGNGLVDTFA
jgi:flagellar hook-length control protein FliK